MVLILKKIIKLSSILTLVGILVILTGIPEITELSEPAIILNVKDFGAIPNDQVFDNQAFQAAHDSIPAGRRAIIFVPAGEYIFNDVLNIEKNNVSIVGEGTRSIIKRAANRYITLFQIPERFEAQKNPNIFPENITIKKLTFDGNDVFANDFPKTGSFANIWVWQGKNIVLSDLLLKNNEYMGISLSNGTRPSENVTIRNIRGNFFTWCLLHLGNVRNALVEQIFGYESPTQKYYQVSHTGIDVEVEGSRVPENKLSEGIVENVIIKDSLFILPENHTATGGISVSPAYGPVNNLTIKNNFFKNYDGQVGVLGYPATENGSYSSLLKNISIQQNWTKTDADFTWHSPMGEYSTVGFKLTGNVINDEIGFYFGVYARGGQNIDISDNTLQTKLFGYDSCMVRVEPNQNYPQDVAKTVSVTNNKYYVYSDILNPQLTCKEFVSPDSQNVTINNNQLLTEGIDITAPQITLQTPLNSTIYNNQNVIFAAEDSGTNPTGIARVVFLVDGIPQTFATQPPFSFEIIPQKFGSGAHTIGAIAWDNRANISRELVVPFNISDNVISDLTETNVPVQTAVPTKTPDSPQNFCGITKINTDMLKCPANTPQILVFNQSRKKQYLVSNSCEKRPLINQSVKKSYCRGKIPEIMLTDSIISKLRNERIVTDPKGRRTYQLDYKKKTMKKTGGKNSNISKLSAAEFRLYRKI